jgi:Brp/Blh family beta-carotene 15,15'-monooxygenase
MEKIYNFSIVFSFFGLWVTSLFPDDLETLFGFILIFSFGILHGSNDILLINSVSNEKTKYPFISVLLTYILTVLSAILLFYFIPLLGLILFVLFSAYHFGEQHWEYRELEVSANLKRLFYVVYGLLILQLLFVLNPSDVIEIVLAISNFTLSKTILLYAFIGNVIIFLALVMSLFYKSPLFKTIFLKELLYLLVFTIIFKVSTLIWGFTIYFILWHSVPSLFEQVNFIYGTFNKKNALLYFKKAFPYWIISLIGISFLYFLLKENTIFAAVFFSFIAAVTFPHALVISKMFKNKKTQPN